MCRSGSGLVARSFLIACACALGGAGCKLDLMRQEIRFSDAGTETQICEGPEIIDASQENAMPTRITRAVVDDLDGGTSPGAAICDGSDAIRLGVATGPGHASSFSEPYGWFFVLTGRCHFYAAERGMLGIREGVLTTQQADALAIDLAIPKLMTLTSNLDACTDDPGTLIATPTSTLSCSCLSCGGDPAATASIHHAMAWIHDLTLVGSALSGPVLALAALGEPLQRDCYPSEIAPWPLAVSMGAVSGLIDQSLALTEIGARFDDAQDSRQLRQLRAAQYTAMLAHNPDPWHIYVRDNGADYALDVRDELPDGDEQAVHDFMRGARAREDSKRDSF